MAGLAQACTACYAKKVRCDRSKTKRNCSNCALYKIDCTPRLRKRKRAQTSPEAVAAGTTIATGGLASNGTSEPTAARLTTPSRVLQPMSTQQVENLQEVQNLLQNESSNDLSRLWSGNDEESNGNSNLRNQGGELAHVRMDALRPPTTYSAPQNTVNQGTADGVTPSSSTYDGRSIYFPPLDPDTSTTDPKGIFEGMTSINMEMLRKLHAFDMPPRQIRTCWIDNFFVHCGQWMPVVERAWLEETADHKPSCLLLQSVFLAGSMVTTTATGFATSAELYTRAKALFLSGYERNPIYLITASLLLQWWNPSGPDQFSLDSSSYWLQTGVGLAYQLGLHKNMSGYKDIDLRRRLFWSLMVRDSHISVAHGRPRLINSADCFVPLPTIQDCQGLAIDAPAYVAYTQISMIMGDIAEAYRRHQLSQTKKTELIRALYWWQRELPDALRLYHSGVERGLRPYNFHARQLHVLYFESVMLVFYKGTQRTLISSPALIASSCIAGLFEEFLIRDEVRYLGPSIWKSFLLTAGLSQISGCRAQNIASDVVQDLQTLRSCLQEFSKRWPTAVKNMKLLDNLKDSFDRDLSSQQHFLDIPREEFEPLLRDFGTEISRHWHLVGSTNVQQNGINTFTNPSPKTTDLYPAAPLRPLRTREEQPSRESSGTGSGQKDTSLGTSHAGIGNDTEVDVDMQTLLSLNWPELDEIDNWLMNV